MFYDPIHSQALIKYLDCKKSWNYYFCTSIWKCILEFKDEISSLFPPVFYCHNILSSGYSFYTQNMLWRSCKVELTKWNYLAGIYFFKADSENTRTMPEICTKLATKTPEWRHWRPSSVFFINFEQTSHIFMVFPLLTFTK